MTLSGMEVRSGPPRARITVTWHIWLALLFLALYVGDLVLDYRVTYTWTRSPCPDQWSDSLFTMLVSGPLLLITVVVAGIACNEMRPRWLWLPLWLAALPVGYGICAWVDSLAYSWTSI